MTFSPIGRAVSLSATCVALACPGVSVAARGGQPGPDAHSRQPAAEAPAAAGAPAPNGPPAATGKPVSPGHPPGNGRGRSQRNTPAAPTPVAIPPAQTPAPAPV